MMKLVKASVVLAAAIVLSGCTGAVKNTDKDCEYHFLLHPAISVSSLVGGCGPAAH